MLRNFPMIGLFGWARRCRLVVKWGDHPRWQLLAMCFAMGELAIVYGARPDSRRMCSGFQYLIADQSG
jgi:hypothetical protein